LKREEKKDPPQNFLPSTASGSKEKTVPKQAEFQPAFAKLIKSASAAMPPLKQAAAPSIPDSGARETGGTRHLPDVLDNGMEIVGYSRQSGYGGKRGNRPEDKAAALDAEIDRLAPGRRRKTFWGVEEGKMSARRPTLIEAVEYALQHHCMIVAWDLSRLVRAWDFDRWSKWHAWPTRRDFLALNKLLRGVPAATVMDPLLTESQRHGKATQRGDPGREPTISDDLALEICCAIEVIVRGVGRDGRPSAYRRPYFTPTLAALAAAYKVSIAAIRRMLARPSPPIVLIDSEGTAKPCSWTWSDLWHACAESSDAYQWHRRGALYSWWGRPDRLRNAVKLGHMPGESE